MKTNTEDNSGFRQTVTLYSFILTVLVIWIHAVETDLSGFSATDLTAHGADAVCRTIQWFFSTLLGQIAVPGFFALSGYLFFRNAGKECSPAKFILNKWKSRFFSLVIPYLIWNTIYFAVYLAAGKASFTFDDIMNGIFMYRYNRVFWYIEQLIILTAMTPLVYLLVSRKPIAVISAAAVFLLASFYMILKVHPVNEDALFYYMAGAAAGMHLRKKAESRAGKGHLFAGLICFVLFIGCQYIYLHYAEFPNIYLMAVIMGRLCGAAVIFFLAAFCINLRAGHLRKEVKLPGFMNFNFLIYAVHYMEIRAFRFCFGKIFGNSSMAGLAEFLVMPALCIALTALTGMGMKRFIPRLYGVLTGGRGSYK